MKAILGTKVGMTQIFDNEGRVVPVTVIEAGPCVVVQKKTQDKDQYEAVQVGYGAVKERRMTQPVLGHFKKTGVEPKKHLREFAGQSDLSVGDTIGVDVFSEGDAVDVTGISKGKGFQGVVKRFHFHGADMTHGSMIHRKPQSSGPTDPARVFKGVRKPGRMGHEQVTVKRLRVVRVDPERNLLLIRGAVPGPNGSLVTVRGAK
jgi:large subunit ribosomal protein L3